MLVSLTGFSQHIDSVFIRGQVISKDKRPLPNVTVRISNTDKEVISDGFGQFELWSPIEGIIEFSCISEPYKISLSSIGAGKKDELLKFEFDLKRQHSNFKVKKLKGRTIKVNKINRGRISDIVLASYNSNFERITRKHYEYYSSHNYKIIFIVDGKVMHESFNINNLDYSSLNDVAIIRIIDSYDKIIFMMSTKSK